MAFPPARSISLTTDAAASAPFEYVMATFAPSAARRLAIAAPMPREPPVMSAIFPSRFLDTVFLLFLYSRSLPSCSRRPDTTPCLAKATAWCDRFLLARHQGQATYPLWTRHGPDHGPTTFCEQPSLESLLGYPMKVGTNTTIEGERRSSSDHRCQYAFVRKAARQGTRFRVQALPALHLRPQALCKFADCQLSKGPSIVQRLRPTLPP